MDNGISYRVVLDTNILVSILYSKNSNSTMSKLLEYMKVKAYIPVYSEEIMEEYLDVLNRKKFSFDEEKINELIELIEQDGINIVPNELTQEELDEMIDRKDIPFLKAIKTLNDLSEDKPFENYLITGNIRHFPTKPFVILAKDFVKLLEYVKSEYISSYER